MKYIEILIEELQGKCLDKKKILKNTHFYYIYKNKITIISDKGIYNYNLSNEKLYKVEKESINSYCMIKNNNKYEHINDTHNHSKLKKIFINEINKSYIRTNHVSNKNHIEYYTKHILKTHKKSRVSMCVCEYINIQPKIYFVIEDNLSLNSTEVRTELNSLISFLI